MPCAVNKDRGAGTQRAALMQPPPTPGSSLSCRAGESPLATTRTVAGISRNLATGARLTTVMPWLLPRRGPGVPGAQPPRGPPCSRARENPTGGVERPWAAQCTGSVRRGGAEAVHTSLARRALRAGRLLQPSVASRVSSAGNRSNSAPRARRTRTAPGRLVQPRITARVGRGGEPLPSPRGADACAEDAPKEDIYHLCAKIRTNGQARKENERAARNRHRNRKHTCDPRYHKNTFRLRPRPEDGGLRRRGCLPHSDSGSEEPAKRRLSVEAST